MCRRASSIGSGTADVPVLSAGVGERSGKIQPGYEGDQIVRNLIITSDDDGVNWSPPRDVTRETKREKVVTTIAGGPGSGFSCSMVRMLAAS